MHSNQKILTLLCTILFVAPTLLAQVSPSPASTKMQAFETRKKLKDQSLVKHVPFENIGPTIFSGRIVDLDVNPNDPSHFYAAYASGGLWYTENNGTTLEPIFDHEAVMTLGDIAVDWDRNIIWVGTGENNSSRSSYSGIGMYQSTDGGKNWKHKGLDESHHISRIILHPTDPNTLWVAALGALYSKNENRGVYKTTDGGKNWTKTLYVNSDAGAVDLVIDPSNPNSLYAATWHRERRAWDFNEGGSGSGIYHSTDGGDTWLLLTQEGAGFPTGEFVGRIGLDIHHENGQTTLYALLDNYNRRPPEDEEETDALVKDDFKTISNEAFLALDNDQLDAFLSDNNFPDKHTAESVKKKVKSGELKPIALAEYLENANSLLFDTPVIGAEVYRSTNNGKSWTKMNEDYIDFLYNSYGYYFGQIRVAPSDPDRIYVLGVPILKSHDAGRTWEGINGDNVHSDHHALWLNPNRDGHLILGNDGGINISYDDGKTWLKMNQPSVGQFYSVAVDMAKPYNVYGGLQDNGVWMGAHTYQPGTRWHGSGQYPYKSIMGGDGMQVAIDTRDNETVYTGFQFGNYYRLNTNTGARKSITPMHELGDRPYRWNWETPIWLSTHNQDIFYMGANKLLRSFNQGNDFEVISDDLTQGGKKGDVPFGTLASIHESPLKFGLIYTGSDDGYVHVTRDGGNQWRRISDRLPQGMWVASVQASGHAEGRVYISLNGYRNDHFNAYCYRSDDYGQNWTRIGINLPSEPVNVIKEDPKNAEVLYVGTDHGAYVSIDGGKSFMSFSEGIPDVPVHDLVVHPRENHLILGTHGRSFFKADVSHLQSMTSDRISEPIFVYASDEVRYSSRWGTQFANWREANEPEHTVVVYAREAGSSQISIQTKDGVEIKSWSTDLVAGLNYINWNLAIDDAKKGAYQSALREMKKDDNVKVEKADNGMVYVLPGSYKFEIVSNGNKSATDIKISEGRRSR